MTTPDPLVELLDQARNDERQQARAKQRGLRRQAEEDATLAGTLVDLAERACPVSVMVLSGRAHHGVVLAVGSDFCVVRSDQAGGQASVCLRLDAVVAVRPQAGERHQPATGDRQAPLELTFTVLLARLAPERPRVAMMSQDGQRIVGLLTAVGQDVVTIRVDGDHQALCYLSSSLLSEATIFAG